MAHRGDPSPQPPPRWRRGGARACRGVGGGGAGGVTPHPSRRAFRWGFGRFASPTRERWAWPGVSASGATSPPLPRAPLPAGRGAEGVSRCRVKGGGDGASGRPSPSPLPAGGEGGEGVSRGGGRGRGALAPASRDEPRASREGWRFEVSGEVGGERTGLRDDIEVSGGLGRAFDPASGCTRYSVQTVGLQSMDQVRVQPLRPSMRGSQESAL